MVILFNCFLVKLCVFVPLWQKKLMNSKLFNIRTLWIILLLFCTFTVSLAQINDFELWSGVQLRKNITKKLRVSFEEEIRFNENISDIKKFYSEIGLSYRLNKHIRFAARYRFTENKTILSYYSTRHRIMADISLRYKISRLFIAFRSRYQIKYIDIYSSETGFVPRNHSRNKLSLKYNIRKNPVSPFTSGELYYQLNNPEGNQLDKLRYTAGFEYNINKKNSFDIYFRIQQQINVNNPVKSYIIGVKYFYVL